MEAALLPSQGDLWQQTLGWQPSPAQQQQLQRLYGGIVAGNRQLNLTRLTEPQDFWEKHLWDSLRALRPWLRDGAALGKPGQGAAVAGAAVVDIGSGGGFPGIPAAIALPQAQVTLMDSTRKKMVFLQQLVAQLGLTNVETVTERAEAAGQQARHRNHYDLALIRAVGPVTVCAEYCLPMVKYGGTAVLYRGQWTVEEAEALEEAAKLLGAELVEVDAFETPLSRGTRHCLYLRKIAGTPDLFPRPVGVPAQDPLP
ncbi:MAG: 16S rRNA (guanine(527)-N(7))-methyltransferase RsmG [Synechococcales cyanobacterium RM1_1_8]|nr:16S rRNA (guanine(527)-N(7))-methyltransferase RsmG [Synechococcales cyanobacterium RM1_1_8]